MEINSLTLYLCRLSPPYHVIVTTLKMSRTVFGEVVDENLEEMEQWIGSLAIVTGASAGIGAAIAVKLVKSGVIVVGIARRLDLLEELASSLAGEKGTFHPKQCDLTNDNEILETFQWVEDTLGPVSILINNAGILKPTTLKGGDTEVWKRTFDVNVLALCICTREALKSMKKHEVDGHIVHVSSIAGHFVPEVPLPEPMLNVYPATKHAVTALTETLRRELIRANSKIKVSAVSPGITVTEVYNDYPLEAVQPLADVPKLQAVDVANAVIYILGTPPGVQVQDLIIRAVGESV